VENIITKKRKFIKKNTLNDYVSNGWILFDRGKSNRNKKIIINPETKECIKVDLQEIDYFLKKGWKKGRKI
jgi:hypothetical protein